MRAATRRCLVAALAVALAGCTGPRMSSREPARPVGSSLIDPDSRRIPAGTFFTSGVSGSFAEASAEHAVRKTPDRDVILRILMLRKPSDVVRWWESGPGIEPERWTHPLSEWERKYVEKMSAASIPEPVRMWPPVEPDRLTPKQHEEAERLFGGGPMVAESYANRENRRRIVNHYVNTHPATLRLSLTQYGFMRDINPFSFSLERGWQVGSGKEMFTEQDVSRLGAAAEFFTALAVGAMTHKVLLSVRPAPPEGVRPPSKPAPGSRMEGPPSPGPAGKVIPLDRTRAARNAAPVPPPDPVMEETPFASTGTDGPPPGPKGGAGRRPGVTGEESPSGHGNSGVWEANRRSGLRDRGRDRSRWATPPRDFQANREGARKA